MNSVRELPKQKPRVETDIIQFGDDWKGVFIRGDNALWYGHLLNSYLDGDTEDIISNGTLRELASILLSCKE